MVQKLLVVERDTKKELEEAIKLTVKGEFKIQSVSVLKGLSHYEAWVVIDIPDNPNKNSHDLLVGFES